MPESSPKTSKLDYLIPIFQFLSTILLTFCSQTFSDEGTKLIGASEGTSSWGWVKIGSIIGMGISLMILLVVNILSYKQSKKIVELNTQIQKLTNEKSEIEEEFTKSENEKKLIEQSILRDFYAISKALCITMANDLKFGSQQGVHERISFYLYDQNADCFFLLSRHSENTDFDSKGHPNYQRNIGNIGKVWENGFWFRNDYPSFGTKKEKENYVKRTMKDGFSKEQVLSLRMKSRLYVGFRISNSQRKHLAIVMLETTNPSRWSEGYLQEFFDQENHRLSNLFEIIHPKTPEISSARKKGF